MDKRISYLVVLVSVLCYACTSTNKAYNPSKKYAPYELQNDFVLLKNVLENTHPSLYWYTPKEKMDAYFDKYYNVIKDSMTEQQFAWLAVAPLINKIHCGHTSMSMSKAYSKWITGKQTASFPLFLKVWNDTMAVIGNLNFKKDSIFKRGTIITSINDVPNKLAIKYMLEFLPEDGYASNVNYHRLSGNFPYYHKNIFGLSKNYTVGYIDSNGKEQKAILPLFVPIKDTTKKDSSITKIAKEKKVKLSKEEKLLQYRSLKIDSSKKFATLTLNTFTEGQLRKFFRKSFKQLKDEKIENLVLDLRSNGGGRVNMSTLLTKYISKSSFKIADSAYTPARGLGKFAKYFKGKFLNNIQMFFSSRKNKDGNYHIRRMENHFYKPKRNNYEGKVFIITSGPTFSASTIFCNAVKGQAHVTLVGEETGGGWYGNSGIMIPTFTLPNTHLKIRMPLFKIVQVNHGQPKGIGVVPDISVPPSYDALIKGYDKKMEVIKEMIFSNP
jgi:Peptidase family S41